MDGMHHDMPSSTNNSTMQNKMMMHMTFFWGKNTEVLFYGWPGTRSGMYVLALIIVFLLSMLIEWLSHSRIIKQSSSRHVFVGLVQTLMHTIRVGLSYLVMLAVMSFNGGIFLMVIAGHLVGFLVFGSRVFKHDDIGQDEKQQRDLPPMTC